MTPSGLASAPWTDVAKRVALYTDSYLDFDGRYSPGGRQRHVRDLASISRDWGREVVVVQKGRTSFETTCPDGVPVIGIRSETAAVGDFNFARKARRIQRAGDVWLYASGESAWPFFAPNSKAVQHGVWWDGPQRWTTRVVQRQRVLGMMRRVRSILCVDTNFINWLRTLGPEGYDLTRKCHYVPNYADTDRVRPTVRTSRDRLSIITARRFEPKRGTLLFCEALNVLKSMHVDFSAHICTVGGLQRLLDVVKESGLEDQVRVTEETLDGVLDIYRNHHIAVVPTLWSEGTSLACVEAIAAGLPVVASAVGGLGNLVVPGFNGLIARAEPRPIAEAIADIWTEGRWETMHQNTLSMREALGMVRWRRHVLGWLQS